MARCAECEHLGDSGIDDRHCGLYHDFGLAYSDYRTYVVDRYTEVFWSRQYEDSEAFPLAFSLYHREGNALGKPHRIGLYFIQKWFGVIPLPDPETYYMDTVPVSLSFWHFLLLNVGTLLISVLMLVGPSYVIAKIKPATSMRYE